MNQTRVIVLSALIILGLYDAWVCSGGNTNISISQFIVDLVNVSPVAYGIICILIGHFGFAMPRKWRSDETN